MQFSPQKRAFVGGSIYNGLNLYMVGYRPISWTLAGKSQSERRHTMNSTTEITPELLKKYDRPGPRYTSYPTVPEWSSHFDADGYRAALERGAHSPDKAFAMYVHIPFCRKRCHYCGCNVVISKKPRVVEEFLDYIAKELAYVAEKLGETRRLVQLHWGGGTPTYLSVVQLERLFDQIGEHFQLDPNAELALEIDPRVTTYEQLHALRRLGFNRISMGVQDLDPGVQQAIGRDQTEEQTRHVYESCRNTGFSGVNLDLIYGLPAQTLGAWEKTIQSVVDMRPDRLAIYSYAHLPDKLKHQAKMDATTLPGPQEKGQLIVLARRMLVDAGYESIGMDHFALPDEDLSKALKDGRLHRNFMGYTTIADTQVLGIGPSAISYVGDAYAQNEKLLFKYYRFLTEGDLATTTGIALSKDDLIRRAVIEQLMCNFRLSFQDLRERFGIEFDAYFAAEAEELSALETDGFFERASDGLRVLPLGQMFIRNLAMVFDAYLKRPGSTVQYSRTV